MDILHRIETRQAEAVAMFGTELLHVFEGKEMEIPTYYVDRDAFEEIWNDAMDDIRMGLYRDHEDFHVDDLLEGLTDVAAELVSAWGPGKWDGIDLQAW